MAMLGPENAVLPPVDCKMGFCLAGAQSPVQEAVLRCCRSYKGKQTTWLLCAVSCYKKVTVVYLLWWKCLD